MHYDTRGDQSSGVEQSPKLVRSQMVQTIFQSARHSRMGSKVAPNVWVDHQRWKSPRSRLARRSCGWCDCIRGVFKYHRPEFDCQKMTIELIAPPERNGVLGFAPFC